VESSELDVRLQKLRDLPVLVVDDNSTNRRILYEIFCSWKMKPVLASSGDEALEMMERAIASGEPFRFAILDCMMPGMDGFELAEEIRKRQNAEQIRLMILSSAKTPNDSQRCASIGIQRYMNKPVVQSDLKDAVVKIMQSDSLRSDGANIRVDAASRSLRVLVAEDGLANQHVAMGLLKAAGHEPFLACDGKEAVVRWQTGTYDVILMDMHMPEMDGLEATRAIRALEKERSDDTHPDDASTQQHIPIIAVTAAATPEDARECRAAGMDDFLTKPIRTKFLQEMLSKHAPDPPPHETMSAVPEKTTVQTTKESPVAVDFMPDDDEVTGFEFPPASDVADLQAASFEISGGIDGLHRLSRIFRDECNSIMKTMDASIAEGDNKSLARAAHTLKGSAQLFRAKRVVAAASKLEDSVKRSETSDFTTMADEVRAETSQLLSLLSKLS
jgi:CheY-like chemotaxis protein/HPt (histidine-containing phosphotransfer) domain-containing protein